MDQPNFSVSRRPILDDAVHFSISGFFSKEAGDEFVRQVEESLVEKRFLCIVDLSSCSVLASPGIAAILRVSLRLIDDFMGRVALIGLDESKRNFLKITGVIPLVETASTVAEAETLLRGRK